MEGSEAGLNGLVERAPAAEAPGSIAVLRLGTLGDAILTTPLYAALKRVWPESRLTVFASAWNAVIPENHPDVDEVVPIPSGIAGIPVWLRTLLGRSYDLYIDPKDHRSTTSRFVAELVRAGRKLTAPGNLPFLSGAEIVPPGSGEHFTESSLAPMLLLAPEEVFPTRPSIAVPESAGTAVRQRIGTAPATPWLVVNVSTGSPTRRWPEEKWSRLLESTEWHHDIAVISAPSDAEAGRRIAASSPRATYVPTGSLMEAAALVRDSYALITSDTSIVHIASALNIPTVALYFNAPRMMRMFSPRPDIHRIVLAPGEEPVAVLTVDEVREAVIETLARIETDIRAKHH